MLNTLQSCSSNFCKSKRAPFSLGIHSVRIRPSFYFTARLRLTLFLRLSLPFFDFPTYACSRTKDGQATVKAHIKLLHDYNEIRDVGQGIMGIIADSRGVRVKQVYQDFDVGEGD